MTNFELAKKYEQYTVDARNHLHRHPELSGQEYETVKYIMAELDKMGIACRLHRQPAKKPACQNTKLSQSFTFSSMPKRDKMSIFFHRFVILKN